MLSKNKIKFIQSLHQKKGRQAEACFIVEGVKMVDELLKSDFEVCEIFALEPWISDNEFLLGKKPQIAVHNITEPELNKLTCLSSPNNVLALVKPRSVESTILANQLCKPLTLVLDGIKDPGNLGTIIRLCHWFGLSNLICSKDCAELYNPKVVQSTMGSLFHVRVHYTNLIALFQKSSSYAVYGACLNGSNIYENAVFEPGFLVIGSESHGISDEVEKFITRKLSIPSFAENHAESLNAGVASAIMLSEFYRNMNYFNFFSTNKL